MTAKASIIRSDQIEYSLWLVFDDKGGVRMTRLRGGLDRNERAVSLQVVLPKSLFKVPELAVSLTLPQGATEIPPINIEAAADALRGVLGCDIDVRVADR